MDSLLSVGISHQSAMLHRMDVIANNIANSSTTGFKGERVTFRDHLHSMDGNAPEQLRDLRMVQDFGSRAVMKEGPIETTDNPLDIALKGDGFLVVQGENGEELFTRNGALRINGEGQLAAASGQPVLDDNGQPIELAQEDVDIQITEDGRISSRAGVIGELQLVRFDNPQNLERQGDSLFSTDQASRPAEAVRVVQGALEGSNVDPVKQVTEMINVMRSYQSMQRTLQDYGDMRSDAIERLPRVQA